MLPYANYSPDCLQALAYSGSIGGMNAPIQKPNRMSAREVEANERGCTVCEFCGGREDGCAECGGEGELPLTGDALEAWKKEAAE